MTPQHRSFSTVTYRIRLPSKFCRMQQRIFKQHLVALVIALSFGAAGCSRAPQSLPQKAVAPVKVRTVSVKQVQTTRTTTQPATVHAYHKASVRSRVSGYLKEVNVDIGDVIEADKPLATVDVPELKQQQKILAAQIARRKAEETQAKAGIELAEANVTAAKARLAEAKSQLKSIDASLVAADAALRRVSDLVGRGSLEARRQDEAREQRDATMAKKEALQSTVESSTAAVAVAEAQQAAAAAELTVAKAETKIAEQQLKELDVQIGFASLKAPFTGIVTQRHAEPGDLVSASATSPPLFVISRVDVVRIHVSVPEHDAALINRGDTLKLTFPAFAAESGMEAKITRTSGSLDPSTRMMLVEAEVKNEDGKLLPGMFGQAEISLGTEAEVAVLPARAVRFSEEGDAYVYALKDNEVSVVKITTGADDGSTIEILAGLDAEQVVIDAHLQRFADGQKVEILN